MPSKSILSDTLLHTLYHVNSRGLETSYNVLDARDYIQWFVANNYTRRDSLYQ